MELSALKGFGSAAVRGRAAQFVKQADDAQVDLVSLLGRVADRDHADPALRFERAEHVVDGSGLRVGVVGDAVRRGGVEELAESDPAVGGMRECVGGEVVLRLARPTTVSGRSSCTRARTPSTASSAWRLGL
jgi:hypothetical protein